jgi:hypothetical protein
VSVADDQDWRLKAEMHGASGREPLDGLLGHLRTPDVVKEVGVAVPHDVVITHDGSLLFAYAADQATLTSARAAIEAVLRRDQIDASFVISHWDDELDQWRQSDPPLTGEATRAREASELDAERVQTRTLVASAGRLIRAEFEQTMSDGAQRLGLECAIVEHPHLLRTQVAFTVTGPKRKIDEFSKDLVAEGWATIRAETNVMMSPL